MPTVMTHAIVGMTLGTLTPFPRRWPFWIASAILPVLPDLDVVGLPFGVGFFSMWGHRGVSHSFVAALVIGALASALLHRPLAARAVPLALYFATITATHGVLDALTNGGPGVAFLAPFDDTRSFFPWRPLPVSPLASHFFSEWGWSVFKTELVLLWLPSALVGSFGLASGRRRTARPAGV
jgi:inner membrane protein